MPSSPPTPAPHLSKPPPLALSVIASTAAVIGGSTRSYTGSSSRKLITPKRLAPISTEGSPRARLNARQCALSSATSPEQSGACGRSVVRSDSHLGRPSSLDPLHIGALLSECFAYSRQRASAAASTPIRGLRQ